jgi:cyclopropane fatty-acyl-phospholipid synthase-like methyltransferase
MSDIDLYTIHPDHYDKLQQLRPDYVGAIGTFLDLAVKYSKNKKDVSIADFCCGTGENTERLAGKIKVRRAMLIDVNKEFIRLAMQKKFGIEEVIPIVSDIIDADVSCDNDMVISMFAYHHVTDDNKAKYIARAKAALKPGGILFLGEIYSPDKETTLKYYEYLAHSIPGAEQNSALKNFLLQTANSDDFEYKVSMAFAHDQLKMAGFELLESKKIWPTDDSFLIDVGTFMEVWRLS